jgi:hypothetical protein
MKYVHQYAVILLQVVILLLLYIFFVKPHSKTESNLKEYWENKKFKTDSIKVDVDYTKLPKPTFKFPVPPAFVFDYTKIPPSVNTTHIIVQNDSLLQVIDSLSKEITTISALYLKLYPSNPKLIYGEFSRDSTRLDLLSIDGRIRSNRFAVNYDKFSYQWNDGDFKANPVKEKLGKYWSHGAYAYAGWDLINSNINLGADYSIKYRKIRLSAESWVSLEKNPQFNARATAGIRLK